jgi:hypothetical protein
MTMTIIIPIRMTFDRKPFNLTSFSEAANRSLTFTSVECHSAECRFEECRGADNLRRGVRFDGNQVLLKALKHDLHRSNGVS